MQTLDDGQALIDGLAEKPEKVVVVGSGYVGLEIAEACVARGFDTTVIDRSKAPLSIIEPKLGEQIAAAMREHGIRLLSRHHRHWVHARRLRARQRGDDEGRSIDADLVVLGLGVTARSSLAADAGLPLGPRAASSSTSTSGSAGSTTSGRPATAS